MLFKSKLLISLASVGVVGGTGAGVYYGVNKAKENTDKPLAKTTPAANPRPNGTASATQNPTNNPSATPNTGSLPGSTGSLQQPQTS